MTTTTRCVVAELRVFQREDLRRLRENRLSIRLRRTRKGKSRKGKPRTKKPRTRKPKVPRYISLELKEKLSLLTPEQRKVLGYE